MKRAIFLATAALLAMLVLAPMALAQDSTVTNGTTFMFSGERTMVDGSPAPVPTPPSGGPAIVLPAASLLLGSGILTYAFLRRR